MASRMTVVLVSLLLATPAVIFWLWLVTLPARMWKLCPDKCWCDPGGYYVDCSKSSLNNIPLIFPTGVQALVLKKNIIKSLEKDSFISRGLTELDLLDIRNCGLETLQLGAFNGLSKLRKLLMGNNELSEITQRTFENTGHLEYLKLDGNRIGHLEVGAFSKLINLKYLYLRANELQYLHPNMFAGLPSLYKLYLDYNPNLIMPPDRPFISSLSLTYLGISNCNVSSVSAETFANVTALEWLNLGYNNLISVDTNILEILPNMSALYLYGNPLQCDCQLREVWRWCQDHNIRTAYWGILVPKCATPSEVQGKYWGVLEKGQCLLDNITYFGDYENTTYSYTAVEDEDPYEYDDGFFEVYKVPISAIFCIFGTAGNVMLLIIIIHNKDMRTVPNMYILNLAISDMFLLMLDLSICLLNKIRDTWLLDDKFSCTFVPFSGSMAAGVSAYSIVVINIQRYTATVNPFHVHVSSQPTWRTAVATICGMWIVAVLFAVPDILSKFFCKECNGARCVSYYNNVILLKASVNGALPLCLITFSYIMTARNLVKYARPISDGTQHPQLNKRRSTAKIVLALTIVFLISYVPYYAFWAYMALRENLYHDSDWTDIDQQSHYIFLASDRLILINSCLNPVAMYCISNAFRRHFKRFFVCRFKMNTPVNNFELVGRN